MNKKKTNRSLENITLEEIKSWADSKTFSRGRDYKWNVEAIGLTQDGGIIAWVDGTDLYATHVWMKKDKLHCDCTCPYDWGGPCKHAVALLLVYLDVLDSKKKIPTIKENDPRLKKLEDGFDWDPDEEDWDEEAEDNIPIQTDLDDIKNYLNKLKKTQLQDLIINYAKTNSDFLQQLKNTCYTSSEDIPKLVASIESMIQAETSISPWYDFWRDIGESPDYDKIHNGLKDLLKKGYTDEVMKLGDKLFDLGSKQVGNTNDEGDITMALAECMETVFKAAFQSTQPPAKVLLWMIEKLLKSDYGILDYVHPYWENRKYKKSDWGTVADDFKQRLNNFPLFDKSKDLHTQFKREHIRSWLFTALEKSGRSDEILPIMEKDAPKTDSYPELVEMYISHNRLEDAKKTAIKAYKKNHKFILVDHLYTIANRQKEYALAAAYQSFLFFWHPNLDTYKNVERASKKANVWSAIRPFILEYLETGKLPNFSPSKKTTQPKWALPPVPIDLPRSRFPESFPTKNILLEIALYEKNIDAVLRWITPSPKGERIHQTLKDKAGEILKKDHPDKSIQLWASIAESLIAQTKPAAYKEAAPYLRKIKDLYTQNKKTKDWKNYLSALQTKNKRKIRLIEILNSLERKSTPNSKQR